MALPAMGQVNTESLRKDHDEEGFATTLGLSIGYKSGNTDIFKVGTNARVDWVKGRYHSFAVLSYERGEKDDALYVNKGFLHLRTIRSFTTRVAAEGFTQKEFNDFILLEDRTLLGAGIRLAVVEPSDELRLYFGTGAMWEHEEYDDPVEPEQDLVRSTSYVSVSFHPDDRIGLGAVAYYQPAFEEFSDYRALASLDFDFKLTQHLSHRTSIRFRYDSEPVGTIESHDLDLTVGLSASF